MLDQVTSSTAAVRCRKLIFRTTPIPTCKALFVFVHLFNANCSVRIKCLLSVRYLRLSAAVVRCDISALSQPIATREIDHVTGCRYGRDR